MTRNVVWRLPQKSAIQIYVSIKYRECRYVVILMVPVMVNMLCVCGGSCSTAAADDFEPGEILNCSKHSDSHYAMVNGVLRSAMVHLALRNMNILIPWLPFTFALRCVSVCLCMSGNLKTAEHIMHLLSFGLMIWLYVAGARSEYHTQNPYRHTEKTGTISEVYGIRNPTFSIYRT